MILDLTKVITQQIIAVSKITTEEQSSAAVDIESVLHDHLNPTRAAAKVAGGASKGLNFCCQICSSLSPQIAGCSLKFGSQYTGKPIFA